MAMSCCGKDTEDSPKGCPRRIHSAEKFSKTLASASSDQLKRLLQNLKEISSSFQWTLSAPVYPPAPALLPATNKTQDVPGPFSPLLPSTSTTTTDYFTMTAGRKSTDKSISESVILEMWHHNPTNNSQYDIAPCFESVQTRVTEWFAKVAFRDETERKCWLMSRCVAYPNVSCVHDQEAMSCTCHSYQQVIQKLNCCQFHIPACEATETISQ